jgi:hypothetical protein
MLTAKLLKKTALTREDNDRYNYFEDARRFHQGDRA